MEQRGTFVRAHKNTHTHTPKCESDAISEGETACAAETLDFSSKINGATCETMGFVASAFASFSRKCCEEINEVISENLRQLCEKFV